MDTNTWQQQQPAARQPMTPQQQSSMTFSIAAVTLAALAFISECFLPASMVFSSLAIVFAILSKGGRLKMDLIGKSSVLIACVSLVFSISLTAFSFYAVMTDPGLHEEFNVLTEQQTGMTFDEWIENYRQAYQ